MDWTTILVNFIAAIPPSLLAYFAWQKGKQNEIKATKIEVSLNHELAELKEEIRASSLAKGKEEGRVEERQDIADRKVLSDAADATITQSSIVEQTTRVADETRRVANAAEARVSGDQGFTD